MSQEIRTEGKRRSGNGKNRNGKNRNEMHENRMRENGKNENRGGENGKSRKGMKNDESIPTAALPPLRPGISDGAPRDGLPDLFSL